MKNNIFSIIQIYSRYASISFSSIDIEVDRGSLVAVVGVVGAGKSSLLSAMLGEMDKLGGYVNVRVSEY